MNGETAPHPAAACSPYQLLDWPREPSHDARAIPRQPHASPIMVRHPMATATEQAPSWSPRGGERGSMISTDLIESG